MVSFSTTLQKDNLYNQYLDINKNCVYYSYDRERKQNSYTKKYRNPNRMCIVSGVSKKSFGLR